MISLLIFIAKIVNNPCKTNLYLRKHPQQLFCVFTPFFPNFFQPKNYFIIFEEFRQICAKFHKFAMKIRGEIICQSWLLFTPFFNFPIVTHHMMGTYLIIVTTLTTWGGVPFSSQRTFFHRELYMDCFKKSLLENKKQICTFFENVRCIIPKSKCHKIY